MEKNIFTDRDAITAQLGKNLLENLSRFIPTKKERVAALYDWIIQSFQMTDCVLKIHKTTNQFFTASSKALLLEAYDKHHTDVQLFKLYVKDLNYDNDRREFGLMSDLSVVLSKLNFASKVFEFAGSKPFRESGIEIQFSEPISLRDRASGEFGAIMPIQDDQMAHEIIAITLDRKGLDRLAELVVRETAISSLIANQEFWHAHNVSFRLDADIFIVDQFGDRKPPKGFNCLGRVLRLAKENVDVINNALKEALSVTKPAPETNNPPPGTK